ncbi:MAG TPA: hypothetical protein VF094_03230 [Gaiellaceae bacterium]
MERRSSIDTRTRALSLRAAGGFRARRRKVQHASMTVRRQTLRVVAALAAGVGAAWLAAHRDFEPYQTTDAPRALLVGWSFVGSGLVAWRQRPRNRLGPAMVFTGFAWFATFLTDAHHPWLFTLGTALENVYLVGFVFIVLSFPSGRLHRGCWRSASRRCGVARRCSRATHRTAASGPAQTSNRFTRPALTYRHSSIYLQVSIRGGWDAEAVQQAE